MRQVINKNFLFFFLIIFFLYSFKKWQSEDEIHQSIFNKKYSIFSLNKILESEFANEKVPLEDDFVWERFDKELLKNGYNQAFLNESLHSMLSLPFFLFLMTALASIFTMTSLKKSDNLNDIAILADVLVMKALDKDGKKVFKLEDKQTLMENADPNILQRIAQKMVLVPSIDDLKKN